MSPGFDITARRIIAGFLIITLLYFSIDNEVKIADYSDPISIAILIVAAYIMGIFTTIMDFGFINFWPLRVRSRIYSKFRKFLLLNTSGLVNYMEYEYPFYDGYDDQLYNYLVVEIMLQDPHAYKSNMERYGLYTDNTRTIFTAVAFAIVTQLVIAGVSTFYYLASVNWNIVFLEILVICLMLLSYSYYLKCEIRATWRRWVVMKTNIVTEPIILEKEK